MLRAESLSDDLVALADRHGAAVGFSPDAARIIGKAEHNRRNASSRTLSGYRDYYDEETASLVAARDHFFSETFGYRF